MLQSYHLKPLNLKNTRRKKRREYSKRKKSMKRRRFWKMEKNRIRTHEYSVRMTCYSRLSRKLRLWLRLMMT